MNVAFDKHIIVIGIKSCAVSIRGSELEGNNVRVILTKL